MAISLLSSCAKNVERRVEGKLRNLTGFDGCGWVIELKEKDKHGNIMLQPSNLNRCNIKLVDGQDIICSYKEVNGASVCMVGTIVQITTIRKKL